jgi:3-phenylpropionate/trans-cinnamate dioxygenase ferredoxin subunit
MTTSTDKPGFIKVASLAQLKPGKMLCVEQDDRRILLANVDGQVYATDDTCTHEDASLSSGCLRGELVKCPLHGSRFSLRTGEPLEEPAEEALRTYEVAINGDDILLNLNQ